MRDVLIQEAIRLVSRALEQLIKSSFLGIESCI